MLDPMPRIEFRLSTGSLSCIAVRPSGPIEFSINYVGKKLFASAAASVQIGPKRLRHSPPHDGGHQCGRSKRVVHQIPACRACSYTRMLGRPRAFVKPHSRCRSTTGRQRQMARRSLPRVRSERLVICALDALAFCVRSSRAGARSRDEVQVSANPPSTGRGWSSEIDVWDKTERQGSALRPIFACNSIRTEARSRSSKNIFSKQLRSWVQQFPAPWSRSSPHSKTNRRHPRPGLP